MHAERSVMTLLAPSGQAQICAEAFGDPGRPAVLLICGAATSMEFWEDEFCAQLAEAGRYVIRCDLRDTGGSTSYPRGEPGYTGADLVDDALTVLDGFGVDAAHIIGISMGGAFAQRLALGHPRGAAGAASRHGPPVSARTALGSDRRRDHRPHRRNHHRMRASWTAQESSARW